MEQIFPYLLLKFNRISYIIFLEREHYGSVSCSLFAPLKNQTPFGVFFIEHNEGVTTRQSKTFTKYRT